MDLLPYLLWPTFILSLVAQAVYGIKIHKRLERKHRSTVEALLGADPGQDDLEGHYWSELFFQFGVKSFGDKTLTSFYIRFLISTVSAILSFAGLILTNI